MTARIKIICIVGARPNFVKIAPLFEGMKKYRRIEPILVHTGQHYDYELSKGFFDELGIPEPDYNLGVGSGSHAWQTAKMMELIEPVLSKENPDLVLVVGDCNSTLAGALAAAKIHIPVVHVEAGLRSFDRRMPEEINRKLTDHLSDFLFATEPSGVKNLLNEGISKSKIFYVGNAMIDTLRNFFLRHARPASDGNRSGNLLALSASPKTMPARKFMVSKRNSLAYNFDLKPKEYAVLTLHRPENVDDKKVFGEILGAIAEIQKKIEIIWPIHPRARKQLEQFRRLGRLERLHRVDPMGYLEMLNLMKNAKFVMTDSGGMQEETTVLGVPCLTLRDNTERPITCEIGTNTVCGTKKEKIIKEAEKILAGKMKAGGIPRYWDGKTSKRIIQVLLRRL